jgi:TatD DNase family protein
VERCVAIGEVGLDYYWSKEKELQVENFKRFIDLASEYDKPLIVHARNAMADALYTLEKKHAERVVLHCFFGSKADAKKAQDLGYYLSFATNICYRDSKSLIKDVSLSNMLAETDSPYLSPSRSGRNEPKNVALAIEHLAKVLEMPVSEVDRIVERNTKKAFML